MLKLANIKVDKHAASLNPATLDALTELFGTSDEPPKSEENTPPVYTGPSLLNLLVLALLIIVVTSGSTMFLVNNLVDNPYLLNAIHALVIVFLYWVFGKLHN